MTVTVTPTHWRPDHLAIDPAKRIMTPTVEGAAPGTWEVSDGGAHGFYLHVKHNGHHVGMANWNQWEAVAAIIEHESGPYTVTVTHEDGSLVVPPLMGLTLTEAKLAAYRAEQRPGATATVTNHDGNEVAWPRRTAPVED